MLVTRQTLRNDAFRILAAGRPYRYGCHQGIRLGQAKVVVWGDERHLIMVLADGMHVAPSRLLNLAVRCAVDTAEMALTAENNRQ